MIFSSMEWFNSSYLGKAFLKIGSTVRPIKNNPPNKIGATTKKIKAMDPPIIYAIVNEKITFSGARTAIRIIIMNAI